MTVMTEEILTAELATLDADERALHDDISQPMTDAEIERMKACIQRYQYTARALFALAQVCEDYEDAAGAALVRVAARAMAIHEARTL